MSTTLSSILMKCLQPSHLKLSIEKASKKFSQQQAELSWKIFSDLDTQDELEMLNLAVFMKTLIDTVPSSTDHIVEDRRGK